MTAPPPLPGPSSHQPPWQQWLLAAGVSLLAALAVVSPFFFLGIASGHDIAFHMASWLDAAGQWKEGILLPRWAEWPNYGFGEPRFIFYPPLSWLFGALLGTVFPWNSVATVFIVCVQTLAGLSGFAFVRRLSGSRFSQLFAAVGFAANPYALVIIYARSDFAELLAIALFPLLFLSAFNLTSGRQVPSRSRSLVSFGFAFCAIWLSNAPAAVIATYTVTFFFFLALVFRRSVATVLLGASGMLLGFGLAGFYLIPALYEQRWINISAALAAGLAPAENFLYAHTPDSEHDAFNHIASSVALLLLFWAVVAAFAAWRRNSVFSSRFPRAFARSVFSALPAAVALLLLPISLPLWRFLPELRFVQFPWRWMSILAICAISLTTFSLRGKAKWVWLVALTVTTAGSGAYLVEHTWWDSEDMPTLRAALLDHSGFEGTDEYDPAGDDHTELSEKQPLASFFTPSDRAAPKALASNPLARSDRQVDVEEWRAEHRRLRVVTPEPARVALRLLDYPAWLILVNGHPVVAQHNGDTRQMVVPVASGESRIEARFLRTKDRTLGGWISVLSLLVSAALLARARKSPGGTGV